MALPSDAPSLQSIANTGVAFNDHETQAQRYDAWAAKPCTIEQLAGLMGNTRQVCWEHYAKWCDNYTDHRHRSVNPPLTT